MQHKSCLYKRQATCNHSVAWTLHLCTHVSLWAAVLCHDNYQNITSHPQHWWTSEAHAENLTTTQNLTSRHKQTCFPKKMPRCYYSNMAKSTNFLCFHTFFGQHNSTWNLYNFDKRYIISSLASGVVCLWIPYKSKGARVPLYFKDIFHYVATACDSHQ